RMALQAVTDRGEVEALFERVLHHGLGVGVLGAAVFISVAPSASAISPTRIIPVPQSRIVDSPGATIQVRRWH
ncbi:MAG: hypothetical protein WBE82_15925, partial [Xanthobacteraceae bacterium]